MLAEFHLISLLEAASLAVLLAEARGISRAALRPPSPCGPHAVDPDEEMSHPNPWNLPSTPPPTPPDKYRRRKHGDLGPGDGGHFDHI